MEADLLQRPADPATTPDGKREEAIDFKRMIHQIHAGAALENGLVVYGFGGEPRDYGSVGFVGNLQNCETCHPPSTYSTEQARAANATTIDTVSTLDNGAAANKIGITATHGSAQ